MADPCSVLGTAVGVISLAMQVSGTLHQIAKDMHGAPKEIKSFATQLEEVTGIVSTVHQVLDKEQHLIKPELFNLVHSAFQRFEAVIKDIKGAIPGGGIKRASWKSFLWAFKTRRKVSESMGSIEATKSLLSLALQVAILAAALVEKGSATGQIANLDGKTTAHVSIVNGMVDRSREVVKRQQDGGNYRTTGKAGPRDARIQQASDAKEDAATWLYRLVFLPAAQNQAPLSNRTSDGGPHTTPEVPSFQSSEHYEGAKSEPPAETSDSDAFGSCYIAAQDCTSSNPNGNAAGAGIPATEVSSFDVCSDNSRIISNLLSSWTKVHLDPAIVRAISLSGASRGDDDFKNEVCKRIERYNAKRRQAARNDIPKDSGRDPFSSKPGRRHARKTQQAQEATSPATEVDSSLEVAQGTRHADQQGGSVRHEGWWAPAVAPTRYQTGRAMTISDASSTAGSRRYRTEGVVIPPDTQDTLSNFASFTSADGEASVYGQDTLPGDSTRRNSFITMATRSEASHPIAGSGTNTFNGHQPEATIKWTGVGGSDLRIDNAHLLGVDQMQCLFDRFQDAEAQAWTLKESWSTRNEGIR